MNPTRVLLIEDDPWVLAVNRGMVEAVAGFVVVGEAQTMQQGEEQVQALQPDLLLVDVYLPDGTGLELIHSLRAAHLDFEAIMITAANDVQTVQRALYDGVLDYLIKPFQQPRLKQALERYLQRRSATQEESFTQKKLDRLLGVRNPQRLPKGIDGETLEQIKAILAGSKRPLSADEVGDQVGVSRVTAWRYLEYLQEIGSAALEMEYGSVGRPIKRYKTT